MSEKKAYPLRINAEVLAAAQRWADDELRSLNAQIEYVLRDALRKAGFNAFTDSVPGPNGTLTRVRVGPVMNRAEADALKAKLKAAGKDGMVRPHP